jgi:iron complex outermembrane receptor protein
MMHAQAARAQPMAQAQIAQAAPEEAPEQVLVTGSLIHGATAVGVPVTNLGVRDFTESGALTTSELFKSVPAADVSPGPIATQSGANIGRSNRINLRELDTGDATRALLMIDGVRFPGQEKSTSTIDPSIIPALSLDRIDVLVDGASATYGSDAVTGVINIVLKRGYDGAVTQLRYTTAAGGKNRYQASQLWGRTWDGGDITLSYEWYDDSPIAGNAHSNLTIDFSPWGLDNRTPINSSVPGTLSIGAVRGGRTGTLCTNCLAIPNGTGQDWSAGSSNVGPLAPFSASTLNWTTFNVPANSGANGTRNEVNPYNYTWYDAAQQRNAAVITIDQRLTKDITFYGEGFYDNRRAQFQNPANLSPSQNDLVSVQVPTANPYYPSGGAPSNLVINYMTNVEKPSLTSAYELADRYMGGFHINLPFGWNGDIYYSQTYDSTADIVGGVVNTNAVSAALGWTIAASPAIGTSPGFGTWTKPGAVPYLNVFCDPTAFKCNSPATLNYISGLQLSNEQAHINEKGGKFDGPLFDVPAGQVKGAVGATYTSTNFNTTFFDNTGSSTLAAPLLKDVFSRQVWAVFGQINIPVFGDSNAVPFFQKLDLEASWRHDQYSDFGGTSNPKISFNWTPIDFLTFRGAWGTNFRAPGYGEISYLATDNINGINTAVAAAAGTTGITCDAGKGSGGDKLAHPSSGTAFPCNAPAPPGISVAGSSAVVINAHFRDFVNQDGRTLKPENAANYALGAEFTPTNFLKGLDIQATWYSLKLTNVLTNFRGTTNTAFNDAARGFTFIVPTDLMSIDPACNNNATPTTCKEFETMVQGILSDPRNPLPSSLATSITWLSDGGTINRGWIKLQGIDFNASYDIDLGDLGAWNAGITGTYFLHEYLQATPDSPIVDQYHWTITSVGNVVQAGVAAPIMPAANLPRVRYRARLGWSNGPWSVTGFVNYTGHYFNTQSAPPNVNGQCTTPGGNVGGGTFPCAIEGYNNLEPPQYLFDLSLGYDTGDSPANAYLQNIGIQLVVQDILDTHPSFEYRIGTGAGNPAAFDIAKSDEGRIISIILTKTW